MQEIQQLYTQGMNTSNIAKRFNVAKSTIIRAMRICRISLKPAPVRYSPSFEPNFNLGYVLGVLYGDGFCTKRKGTNGDYEIGLNSIDKEFVAFYNVQFCKLIGRSPLNIHLRQRKDLPRQPYYRVRGRCLKLAQFYKGLSMENLASLLLHKPFAIGFLRGFFDSEGCICLQKNILKSGKISDIHPKRLSIGMSNTDKHLLELVKNVLQKESILSWGPYHQPMPNRWNVKPLYQLSLKSNRANLLTFVLTIGTRIERKQRDIWLWKAMWNL